MLRNRRLRVLTWNTHVGIALRSGGLRWLRRKYRPDVVLIQEAVPSPQQIRDALGPGYLLAPARQEHPRRCGTYVAYRRARFRWLASEATDITFGEVYERSRVIAVLEDRKTGRVHIVSSVHIAALGKGFTRANPVARRRHIQQAQAVTARLVRLTAQYAASEQKRPVVIAGGDVNERLREAVPPALRPSTFDALAEDAGLRSAWRDLGGSVSLDDVWASRWLRPRRRAYVPVPFRGSDHAAVVVDYRRPK